LILSSGETPAFLWFFANLLRGYRIMEDAPATGAEALLQPPGALREFSDMFSRADFKKGYTGWPVAVR
jgi:hypothetical protein